jgi:hypothetical protein
MPKGWVRYPGGAFKQAPRVTTEFFNLSTSSFCFHATSGSRKFL